MNDYLAATFFIDCDHEAVREKAKEITEGIEGAKEKSIRLFYFVRDGIKYNIYAERSTDGCFKASHVLEKKEGYCVQKAVLLVALARAAGIPARLRFAEIRAHLTPPAMVEKRGTDIFPWHGFTDLFVDGLWVKATPTYDREYCGKMGVKAVDFDGKTDALLPARADDGRVNVEYLQHRGFFTDLPLDEIRKASRSWTYIKA